MAAVENPTLPREVENKQSKSNLLRAIRMALDIESTAVRRNTQSFNNNRYTATQALPDYQELKDRARAIKQQSIARSPELIAQLEQSVRRNGGHFFFASNGEEASDYIRKVCQQHSVRTVVKGKSMTSEEIRLNRVLEAAGIVVTETDLAEFILQAADEQPSHIIAPAIHYSRERITALFRRKFKTDLPLDTGEDLTRFARERLREAFLSADAGITGANLIAADSGTLLLVESEANIRMTSLAPPLHIALAGLEKIVPSRADFVPFVELLAASATGQSLSTYTSILKPPLPVPFLAFNGAEAQAREFHLVIIDNGRNAARLDPILSDALNCIRCSACLNSCANFQTVGGHAFGGETYSGGIGGTWEAITTGKIANARFSDLCTGCSRCIPQCPVRIDIPRLNVTLRQRLIQADTHSPFARPFGMLLDTPPSERVAPLQKQFFANYHKFAAWGVRLSPLSNWGTHVPGARWVMEKVFGVDRRRTLAPFPKHTMAEAASNEVAPANNDARGRIVLLADTFNNYGSPEVGLAALRVLRAIGVDVVVSDPLPDGRAALSQGLVETASRQARALASHLKKFVDDGRRIVVIEPSVLAMLVSDFRHLLGNEELFQRIKSATIESVEFVAEVLSSAGVAPFEFFKIEKVQPKTRVFVHTHCQQKTSAHPEVSLDLLRRIGFDVTTSRVECCGMAGSFGYKKDYYDLSVAVGADLFAQIEAWRSGGDGPVIAFGISCAEQVRGGLKSRVLHPMQLLETILK
jgi:iron-sulfur cluster protein